MSDSIQKTFTREVKIPSCTLDMQKLEKFRDLIVTINEEFAVAQLNTVASLLDSQKVGEGLLGNEVRVKNAVMPSFKIMGQNGDQIETYMPDELNWSVIPMPLKEIRINSGVGYTYLFKESWQRNRLVVVIDFSSHDVMDLLSSPTKGTENLSSISISGDNATLVNGAYEQILRFFIENKSGWNFLHTRNIYDFSLWLGLIPFLFFLLSRFDDQLKDVGGLSSSAVNMLYICIFLFLLLFFRIIYNWGRWLFPYIEFELNKPPLLKTQRTLFATATLAIFTNVIWELLNLLSHWISKV